MIIDAKHAVMGRLASYAAKQLLKGNPVAIFNAENVIITGDPLEIKGKYLQRRRRGSPQHGPFFPRRPDLILRRTIRGMVDYKKEKGRAAMKKLRIHIGVPQDLDKKEAITLKKEIRTNFITLGELAKALGWQG